MAYRPAHLPQALQDFRIQAAAPANISGSAAVCSSDAVAMGYDNGSLQRCGQSPQRARKSVWAFSHPVVLGPNVAVRGAPASGSFAVSKASCSSCMPLRHCLPPRPMSAASAMSRRQNASLGSKGCIAQSPYSRPSDKLTAQNEAGARQNRAHGKWCGIRSQAGETDGQYFDWPSHEVA